MISAGERNPPDRRARVGSVPARHIPTHSVANVSLRSGPLRLRPAGRALGQTHRWARTVRTSFKPEAYLHEAYLHEAYLHEAYLHEALPTRGFTYTRLYLHEALPT